MYYNDIVVLRKKEGEFLLQEIPYRTTGKIVSIQQFGALVELDETHEVGILHISKISERFVSDVTKFLTPGERIRVDVVKKTDNRVELSIINIPHYRNIDSEFANEFEILAEQLPVWIDEKNKRREDK